MSQDDALHELDRRECVRLLAKVPVGRVVYARQALPAVLPVNFRLDTDSSVLLRTTSDLVRVTDGAVVAFEAARRSQCVRPVPVSVRMSVSM